MKNITIYLILTLQFFLSGFISCTATKKIDKPDYRVDIDDNYRTPEEYNFKFVGYNAGINDPKNDRRAYYKILIDKIEEGRTTTGLESQEKIFEAKLSHNRHLMVVEKWVLDKRAGKYIKLNNIDQPKPNFIYFKVPDDRIVLINMVVKKNGKADFKISFEADN